MLKRARAKQREKQPDRRPDLHEEIVGVLNKFEIRSPVGVFLRRRTRERRQKFSVRARIGRRVGAGRRYARQGDPGRSL